MDSILSNFDFLRPSPRYLGWDDIELFEFMSLEEPADETEDKTPTNDWYRIRNELVKRHVGLVVHIWTRYNFCKRRNDSEDCLQEGFLGLMSAIAYYDSSYGYKFSTYSYVAIKRRMRRYCLETDNEFGSVSISLLQEKARRSYAKISHEYSRPPTEKEWAEDLDIPISTLHAIKCTSKSLFMTGRNNKVWIPEKGYHQDHGANLLFDEMKRIAWFGLNERSSEILQRRFDGETLEQIGNDFGVSRERIRQIEFEAKKKAKRNLSGKGGATSTNILETLVGFEKVLKEPIG